MTKVYAGIIAIPLGAILLASAIGGDGGNAYGYQEVDLGDVAASIQESSGSGLAGGSVSEAESYSGLGHLNPCIFIECEGE